jgi:uncharacterized membrane protein YdjX (TVP38/TMEM64 family)
MESHEGEPDWPREPAPPAWKRWLLLSAILLTIGTFYALGGADYLSWEAAQQHRDEWQRLVQEHWLTALAVFFVGYVIIAALALPVTPVLSITAGILFGRETALVLVSFASTAGASLAFLNSRYLFRDLVQRHFGRRLAAIDAGVKRSGAYYLLALRLMPVVPFSLINLGLGLTAMPLRTFWWVSQLGMLPVAFIFVNAGAELGTLESPEDILTLPRLVALGLLSVVPLGLAWLASRRREPE